MSFLIPAFNEEALIVETIQTYLSLNLNKKEIIVIDDGSHDKTLRLLKVMFQLRKSDVGEGNVYQSITYPELVVLEASHLGKAQALNLGVRHASFDIICTMDADTVPVARGVEATLRAFAQDKKLIACGGVIQVLESKMLKDNSPFGPGPQGWLPSFQRTEYIRTFICERLGWSYLNSTLLISGAFCMLKKSAVKRVGGFNHQSITEDFDLVVRLRKEFSGDMFRFRILPITTCYTQVPATLKHLCGQRMRWQSGLVQTLSDNLSMFFKPAHGLLGLFAVPYFWIVEVLSPVVEALVVMLVPWALYQGTLSVTQVAFFLGLGLAFNMLITMLGIHLDNNYVSQGNRASQLKGAVNTLLLNFGYKQLCSWWRLKALIKRLGRSSTWGEKSRTEIIHSI